jgi:hypothetical protein
MARAGPLCPDHCQSHSRNTRPLGLRFTYATPVLVKKHACCSDSPAPPHRAAHGRALCCGRGGRAYGSRGLTPVGIVVHASSEAAQQVPADGGRQLPAHVLHQQAPPAASARGVAVGRVILRRPRRHSRRPDCRAGSLGSRVMAAQGADGPFDLGVGRHLSSDRVHAAAAAVRSNDLDVLQPTLVQALAQCQDVGDGAGLFIPAARFMIRTEDEMNRNVGEPQSLLRFLSWNYRGRALHSCSSSS